MRYRIGNDSWVCFELDDPAGLLLYVRMAANARGRYVIREMYADGSEIDVPITGSEVSNFPLDLIEAVLNQPDEVDELERKAAHGRLVPLAVLASYYATNFGKQSQSATNWIAAAHFSAFPDGNPVEKVRRRQSEAWEPSEYRLPSGPGDDGLTDDFLRAVARAYAAAVERGESPNRSIADDVEAPLKTVQRWVYTARQRGIMPAGRRGAVG